ncbi:hypothetical protein XJ44_00380 [Thermosipho affectus]|uniref:Tetratricopeptide TPR_2 repeat protein n=1 Tax=Thermosipho affectus TaxID=660294 RepID=A0ABX3IJL5_9BACT|nr:tetratricopeptide repeat protein [Thermosipho affectus]ONN28038.1 hypothetical protein XJ44_00380 [Thermosipho affectus]
MNDNLVRFIRKIMKEGKYQLAESIIQIVEREYPFLKFEYAVFSGDLENARKIFESLSYEEKFFYGIALKTGEIQIGDLENAVEKIYNELDKNIDYNSIKSEYPEVVQVIRLELEKAIRNNDKELIRYLKGILLNFEPNLDLELQEKKPQNINIFIMGTLIIILIFTIISLFNPTIFSLKNSLDKINSKIEVNFEKLNTKILESSNEVKNEIISSNETVSKILEEIKTLQQESSKNLILKLSEVEENLKVLENSKDKETKSVELFERLNPKNIETLRFLWLMGYEYYRQKNYLMSINILEFVIDKAVSLNVKNIYFLDDTYYYRALNYYQIGDFEKSYLLFKDFIERFPNSTYSKHAKYFIERVGGLR